MINSLPSHHLLCLITTASQTKDGRDVKKHAEEEKTERDGCTVFVLGYKEYICTEMVIIWTRHMSIIIKVEMLCCNQVKFCMNKEAFNRPTQRFHLTSIKADYI